MIQEKNMRDNGFVNRRPRVRFPLPARTGSQAHRAPRALADVAGMFGRAFREAIAARKDGQ